MKISKISIGLCLVALLFFALGFREFIGTDSTPLCTLDKSSMEKHTAVKVVDGDTLDIETGERVRLVGINTPEKGEKCSSDASASLKEMTLNKTVYLDKDAEDMDKNGRLLRYVYTEDFFVSLEQVRQGFAIYYPYGGTPKCGEMLEKAQEEAKTNERCIWETSSLCDIEVSEIQAKETSDLNSEYIVFENIGEDCVMAGWTVQDNSASHRFKVPTFTLKDGEKVTLHTGVGTNTKTDLYWGMKDTSVWNNAGDTIYLRDSSGDLVLTKSY